MIDRPDSIEAWLFQLGQPNADRDYHPGHTRINALLEGLRLQRPWLRIRVAGTNGKGSTAIMLASALQACGYRTGLYTSPHLHRFNERICIDGEVVEDIELGLCMEQIMPRAILIGASYFEVATAIALYCFSKARVDIEILEAGVGARLDATTAVPADAAILTPIALDHQNWLGDTLGAIASEKAWAMDGCELALSAPQAPEVLDVLQAHRSDVALVDVAEVEAMPPLHVVGSHQRLNAALAWRMVRMLSHHRILTIQDEVALAAIVATEVPARLQRMEWGKRHIWLDAAHNLHAVQMLLPSLKSICDRFESIVVLTREDRDLSAAIPLLQPLTRHLVVARGNEQKAVYQVLDQQIATRPEGDFLVMGSFITINLASKWLDNMQGAGS